MSRQIYMTSENKRELEQQEQQIVPVLGQERLNMPEDYQRMLNDTSHIIENYGDMSMQIEKEGLTDYMKAKFSSRELTPTDVSSLM